MTVAALISCTQFLFPKMEVIGVVNNEISVTVEFSSDVNSESIKNAFSLICNKENVNGIFQFMGKYMIFFPEGGIKENSDYELCINCYAESNKGISLDEIFYYAFSTKSEKSSPFVIDFFPRDNEILEDQPEYFYIRFSNSIERNSFDSSFSITPYIDFVESFEENGRVIKLFPKKDLKKGVDYSIKIKGSLKDCCNNYLGMDHQFSFKCGYDKTIPNFLIYKEEEGNKQYFQESPIENHCLKHEEKLIIEFSKCLSIENISPYIEIYPFDTKFEIESDRHHKNAFSISINSSFDKKIIMTVKKGIADLYGNETPEDKVFELFYDNEIERPVSFITSFIQIDEDAFQELNEEKNYSTIGFDPIFYGNDHRDKECKFIAIFAISKESETLNFYSAIDGISFKTSNGCCSIISRKAEMISQAECLKKIKKNRLDKEFEGKLCCIEFHLDVSNTDKKGLVYLNLSDSIQDSLGNSMERKYSLCFNK